jgi:predicted transcriptional regulator
MSNSKTIKSVNEQQKDILTEYISIIEKTTDVLQQYHEWLQIMGKMAKKLRELQGYSLRDLGRETSIDSAWISQFENGALSSPNKEKTSLLMAFLVS